jgi:hypothetical protein
MRRPVDRSGQPCVQRTMTTAMTMTMTMTKTMMAGAFVALIQTGSTAHAGATWCGSVYGPDGGYVTCAYVTQEQCIAAVRGVGGICYPNPAAHAAR